MHAFYCLLMFFVPAWAAPSVTLLLSDTSGIYQQAASALQTELEAAGITVVQQGLTQRSEPRNEDWVVALGVAALQRVLGERSTTPVLAALVPRASYLRLTADTSRPITALYLDQPLERMAALQRIALPNNKRFGVLLGPSTRDVRPQLALAAASRGLTMRYREPALSTDVFPELSELIEEVDVLWLLPDPLIVNRNNLQSLFLQTYRQRSPVLAYSAGLVEAGALLGLYATPMQIGREAGQWLKDLVADAHRLPPPRYPASFTVAVNASVARSLNLALPSVDELSRRLHALRTQ